jgi:hypothetical protein
VCNCVAILSHNCFSNYREHAIARDPDPVNTQSNETTHLK